MHACAIPPRISRQRPKRPMRHHGKQSGKARRGRSSAKAECTDPFRGKGGLKRLKEYDCACGSSVR